MKYIHYYIHNSEGQPRGWVTRGIRLINWILLVLAFVFVALRTFWFFTSVKLMGSGSATITAFKDNSWTENDTLSILASSSPQTTANVKTPVRNNGRIIDLIEYVNQTDELHILSLASTDITAGYLTRPNLHCALNFDTTDEITCHPALALMQEQQLTNNIHALSRITESPQRNPPWSEVDSNGASCLTVDLVQKMNTEVEQN